MAGPLGHVRVLELSRVLAGPWAAQTLADLGATVIKVEKPGTGDDTRAWGPPYASTRDGSQSSESAYFLSTNRGKRSVTIDFVHPEGQKLVQALAARSDVVIENFKVGGLKKYGLDYPSLRSLNPRLIYCSITGFGQTGPYSDRLGYDFIIQGMAGLMSITGEPDSEPGGGSMKVGVAVADIFTGLYATTAILGALAHRERTGEGQHIDIALFDSQVAALANQAMNYLVTGVAPQRLGNAHPNIVPYQTFAASDGHIIVAIGNEGQYARMCEAVGRPDLIKDKRFVTNVSRVAHRRELSTILGEVLRARSRREWLEILEGAGVPCGPINTIADVFSDPQVQERGLRLDLPHPIGSVPSVGNPIKYSATPISYRCAPPVLGADTETILIEVLGLSPEDVQHMRKGGII
jgi:crotonobetainyl-CoA:carnitine CoA-transferase CaiB-like acyl-CoA transferase